jgi:hypothetical protein
MRADYGNDLLAQEVVYQQFDDRVPEPVAPQAMLDAGGAITGITSKNDTGGEFFGGTIF